MSSSTPRWSLMCSSWQAAASKSFFLRISFAGYTDMSVFFTTFVTYKSPTYIGGLPLRLISISIIDL